MTSQLNLRFALGVLITLMLLPSAKPPEAQFEPDQFEPLQLDESVVEIIERIPAPQVNLTPEPRSERCGEQSPNAQTGWTIRDNEIGEPVLCNLDTGEIQEITIDGNWIRVSEPDWYYQPAVSPDGEWLVLVAYGDEQYDYLGYSLSTGSTIELGSIPQDRFLSSYPPHPIVWLSSSQGAVIYPTNSDSPGDRLYSFDLFEPESMTRISGGWPRAISEPPARVEFLHSGRWVSSRAGTQMGNYPCRFEIFDAQGFRVYPLEYDCQVEARSSFDTDPDGTCDMIHSDGEILMTLRVIDFEAGVSELVAVPIEELEGEPTVLHRGEIDYMLQNEGDAALSLIGTDGEIPYALYQECWLVDRNPFLGSDVLIATTQGTHIIPSEELPEDFLVRMLAISPDKSRVLLNNGAIYDVVQNELVANITGGAFISGWIRVDWQDNDVLVFTEPNYISPGDQITVRLRG